MVLTRTDLDDMKNVIVTEVRAIFTNQLKTELVTAISQEIEKRFQAKFSTIQKQYEETEIKLLALQEENLNLRKILDSNEQYSRRRNLRIMGMKKSENENTLKMVLDLFNKRMDIPTINSSDIKKCHRIAAKNQSPDKPPAVLIEFNNVNKRSEVLKKRKCLKNTNIFIKEDLTKHRLKLFADAVSKFSVKNAWCLHGNVYVRNNGVVHRIESDDELKQLKT